MYGVNTDCMECVDNGHRVHGVGRKMSDMGTDYMEWVDKCLVWVQNARRVHRKPGVGTENQR